MELACVAPRRTGRHQQERGVGGGARLHRSEARGGASSRLGGECLNRVRSSRASQRGSSTLKSEPSRAEGRSARSTDPCSRSTDPCSRSTDPCSRSTDPCSRSTDPCSRSTDPCSRSTDPCSRSTDPCSRSTDPCSRSTDPCSRSTDPCSRSTDPCSRSTDPCSRSTDPCSRSTDPCSRSTDPFRWPPEPFPGSTRALFVAFGPENRAACPFLVPPSRFRRPPSRFSSGATVPAPPPARHRWHAFPERGEIPLLGEVSVVLGTDPSRPVDALTTRRSRVPMPRRAAIAAFADVSVSLATPRGDPGRTSALTIASQSALAGAKFRRQQSLGPWIVETFHRTDQRFPWRPGPILGYIPTGCCFAAASDLRCGGREPHPVDLGCLFTAPLGHGGARGGATREPRAGATERIVASVSPVRCLVSGCALCGTEWPTATSPDWFTRRLGRPPDARPS